EWLEQLLFIHIIFLLVSRRPLRSTLFPYTTLFRSFDRVAWKRLVRRVSRRARLVRPDGAVAQYLGLERYLDVCRLHSRAVRTQRSEEHTSELQSRRDLVCRLLLEKKKTEIFSMSPT